MKDEFVESVYLTLTDNLLEEYCVPGVENLYDEGKLCERCYNNMLAAYERLLQRLGGADSDPDAELMIDALLSICKEVGYAMYRCGEQFAAQERSICVK